MRRQVNITFVAVALWSVALGAAEKYTGPRPSKADVPYLAHADNLIETEKSEAREEKRKDGMAYVIPGASSPVRTPLAEPIFLLQVEKIQPEKLELYRLDSKNGQREIFFHEKKKKDGPRPVILSVRRLDEGLFRIEVQEGLESGEYSLTPAGSNQVFTFQVY